SPYATVAQEVTRSRRKMQGGPLSGRFLFRLFGSEQLAHLGEERRRLRVGVLAGEGGELLEQLTLLLGQLLRHLDGHAHVLIAALVAVEVRDALSAQPEHLAALRAGRDLHLHLPIERRHVDGRAQRRLGEADRDLADDLAGPLALAAGPGDLEEPLRHPQLAGSVAGGTGLWSGAGPGARPVADGAFLVAGNLDLRLGAEGRLGEAHLQVVAEVRSPLARGPRPPALPEDLAEDVPEDVVDVPAESRLEGAGSESARRLVPEP